MSDASTTPDFSAHELHVLTAVLDQLIPRSRDGRLPPAGQLGLARTLDASLRKLPDLKSMIAQGLAELDDAARARKGAGFTALPAADQVQLLNEQGFVFPLMLQSYIAYYQDPRVVAALGMQARPPHPKGYEMQPNDLSLLDPVRRRGSRYREC